MIMFVEGTGRTDVERGGKRTADAIMRPRKSIPG
jgi:hypothetical protein